MREANCTTHELARHCYENHISCNWVEDPPSFILESLVNDVSILCLINKGSHDGVLSKKVTGCKVGIMICTHLSCPRTVASHVLHKGILSICLLQKID